MANRLIHESSPYLLQHADNPVDWYAWGEEALGRAKEEDRPILLSIGYSACHWCHVMEHESFEDPEIAGLMNESFVNIKVDREERPDLDSIYMQAVVSMTGHGGWPMTMFLTPDLKPFFGGTYFPPEDRHGMPGFRRVIEAVAEMYRTRRAEVTKAGEQLLARLQQQAAPHQAQEPLTADALSQAYDGVASGFDHVHGGLGDAPKFPQAMAFEFLLRYHARTGEQQALDMVEDTLRQMARGGIYDQVGGGFHRYSTDEAWLVPHFEKMLYDNALLSRLYTHAYQATGRDDYARVARETFDYVLREMTGPEGGFYSTQDADSEGVEGKFFLWTPQEIDAVLGEERGRLVRRYYGVTEEGNFEGANILHVPHEPEEAARQMGMSPEELASAMREANARLLTARGQRVAPARDEKVLTAWNGMMLRSFAEAAVVFDSEEYRRAAVANATFVLERLRVDGRLLRTYKDGTAKLKGYLEDYSMLIDGLLALYEATFQERWLQEARGLADSMIRLFWDKGQNVLFDTGSDHEELLVRPRATSDNAMPSGGSVAAEVLLRLAVFTGEGDYASRAATELRSVAELMSRYPTGFGNWLCALDFYLAAPKEIAVVGPRSDPGTRALLEAVFGRYLPNRVVAGREVAGPVADGEIPLLQGKTMVDGKPTAYVCEHYACQAPVTDAEALAAQLTG
ncbi:MAG: thioredoxin domain-containing protein [Chloroflexi bacterium]|nr:thioredoxin domain-containing protein [Chloroflexota bacterium]